MTTLTPAYGRDFKAAKASFLDDGQDWIISDFFHPYDGDWAGQTVNLRFNKLTKIAVVKVPE